MIFTFNDKNRYKRYSLINMFLYINAINSFAMETTRNWSVKYQFISKCFPVATFNMPLKYKITLPN